MKSQRTRRNQDYELESLQAQPHIKNKNQEPWIDTICRTKVCTIPALIFIFCVMSAIPITKVVIGIIHRDDCIIRSSIPIYMIVSGLIEILVISFLILPV